MKYLLLLFSLSLLGAKIINKNPLTVTAHLSKTLLSPGENTQLNLELNLADKHIGYADKLKIIPIEPKNMLIGNVAIANSFEFQDKFTKLEKIGFKGKTSASLMVEIPEDIKANIKELKFELIYQACTDDYCLLPKTVSVSAPVQLPKSQTANTSNSMIDFDNENILMIFILVFFAGVLTSFTPCVFPMIPITIAILSNKNEERTKFKQFLTSVVYVLGIALTYSALGLFAASTGSLFGSLLTHPLAVGVISFTFLLMGLSLFGLFEIQLPAKLQTKLQGAQGAQGFLGALIAGLVAGIVASPCVGPVLVGILTYVAQSQNMMFGFWLLFVFAVGLGQLFIVLGVSSHLLNKLPKAGGWMIKVKYLFGIIMIGFALYYAYPVLKQYATSTQKIEHQLKDGWQSYSEKAIAQAKAENKAVVIDFWAEWCGACFELENKTFSDPKVKAYLDEHFVLLKYDATYQTEEFKQLQEQYNIVGLPHVAFYNTEGEPKPDLTLTGFENAKKFYERIQKLVPKK